jgi:hypothetical protein
MRTLSLITALALSLPGAAAAQSAGGRVVVPFALGEELVYDVKFGILNVGDARMTVAGLETVRGREVWHTAFTIKGGTFFYKLHDRYESWFDTRTFSSLRHVQDVQEGGYKKKRLFEIFPDREAYTENGGEEKESVPNPLDDGSFLYFVRTVPFSVGQTYTFNRYFRPDRNPVIIRVVRREHVDVPAGEFDCVVIQPIIKTSGIFGEGGRAEIWISDDDRHIIVQIKSHLKFGSLNLYLKSYRPTSEAPAGQ